MRSITTRIEIYLSTYNFGDTYITEIYINILIPKMATFERSYDFETIISNSHVKFPWMGQMKVSKDALPKM